MPSAAFSRKSPARHDDLDNYHVGDLSDDPFASPSPAKKRKEADSGLGIDKQVSVQKRARVPTVKLDEDRLLGPAGIPRLRERARGLRSKGRGHEFSDAARLLTLYQLWLDDLFPKARFLDALAMVEKVGHKKRVMVARTEWINECKPKPCADEDEEDGGPNEEPALDTAQTGHQQQPARLQTPPPAGDVPDDDDIYDATPRPAARTCVLNEEDDLDALIAESEERDGNSRAQPQVQPSAVEPDGDNLDALIAEAEGGPSDGSGGQGCDDFADDEAAMEEMEGLW